MTSPMLFFPNHDSAKTGPKGPEGISDGTQKSRTAVVLSIGLILIVIAAMGMPAILSSRVQHCGNSCTANLKQINGAIHQWALVQEKLSTDMPDRAGVMTWLKGGEMPRCPKGGSYILPDKVAGEPRCSKGVDH